jgi:hypothetical protein
MIEVFKTDVNNLDHARMLVDRIHKAFSHCRANFDLQDCDKILRVNGVTSEEEIWQIVTLVRSFGWHIEILNDDESFNGNEFSAERLLMDDSKK